MYKYFTFYKDYKATNRSELWVYSATAGKVFCKAQLAATYTTCSMNVGIVTVSITSFMMWVNAAHMSVSIIGEVSLDSQFKKMTSKYNLQIYKKAYTYV